MSKNVFDFFIFTFMVVNHVTVDGANEGEYYYDCSVGKYFGLGDGEQF